MHEMYVDIIHRSGSDARVRLLMIIALMNSYMDDISIKNTQTRERSSSHGPSKPTQQLDPQRKENRIMAYPKTLPPLLTKRFNKPGTI